MTQKFAATRSYGPLQAIITTLNTLKFAEQTPAKLVYLQELAKSNHAFLAAAFYTVHSVNMRALIVFSELTKIVGVHEALFKTGEGQIFSDEHLSMLSHFEQTVQIRSKKGGRRATSQGSEAAGEEGDDYYEGEGAHYRRTSVGQRGAQKSSQAGSAVLRHDGLGSTVGANKDIITTPPRTPPLQDSGQD